MIPDGIRELDRRAVLATVDLVATVGTADLGRPTPCAGWTLGDLLAHMIAGHHGFAAATAGATDLAPWRVEPLGDDPAGAYAASAAAVLAAFAADGVPDRGLVLPEISPTFRFPAPQAISFHFIDYVVHGWDVARSLGVPFEPEPDLLAPAVTVARAVPDGPGRLAPGSAFRPGLPVPADATDLAVILALLGRSPTWPD